MSDNKIRCLLAYRIPRNKGAGNVVLLAKYDHASQYETHSGASGDASTLYGGRDKSYADAVSMVVGNDPPGNISEAKKLGGFKVVQSEMHQVVYGADSEGICLAVITGLRYQSRVAITMLLELYDQFAEKFGLQAKAATNNSLSKKAKSMFESICKKYDDPSKVDKASELIAKVDQVKSTMSDNIATMLKNTEKAETIAQQSEQLSEQATVFKKKSTDLKKQMRWKNMKMTLILVTVVVLLFVIIVVPLIMKMKNAAKTD